MALSKKQTELTNLLDKACRAYEQENTEIMTNYEYDKLYDELKALEEESGIVLANSPTVKAGYEVLGSLPKFRHEKPCLSLDKTKSVDELSSFLNDKIGVLSWKMDGLTVVLSYSGGELVRAVTRGNGEVGEIITNNARTFKNIPLKIPFRGELTIRGEAVIKYSDFEIINEAIEDPSKKYKNPRNLCSGTVRQLNNEITASRSVFFFAFSLEGITEGPDAFATVTSQYEYLSSLGFDVVEYRPVDRNSVYKAVEDYKQAVSSNDFPTDGLVLIYDDIAYGESLGMTSKFPRNAIAFKWKDETALTKVIDVVWQASRTGLINPVVVFEPVLLEGTTVARASVHNLSVFEELALGYGDVVEVYKANMIIPQIAVNHTKTATIKAPEFCPVCNHTTVVNKSDNAKFLICPNETCPAKTVKKLVLFVTRDAMNIEGLSEATLEKLINMSLISCASDLYELKNRKDELYFIEGFKEKSVNNLLESIEKSKNVNLENVIYALGIPGIGLSNAKAICKAFNYSPEAVMSGSISDYSAIDGIGDILAVNIVDYFSDEKNVNEYRRLLSYLNISVKESVKDSFVAGKIFVITGSVNMFSNRNELKSFIEERGGKVASSVSNKTDYLINNDVTSSSSKNKKARELGIAIISEQDFVQSCQNVDGYDNML
ncbi:MAG: NAD-dependent DNA ligase LigA [Clostridiales bacterium]|nr:NAD-dependent DNA ligase LigA [Clostridiales bacterium]